MTRRLPAPSPDAPRPPAPDVDDAPLQDDILQRAPLDEDEDDDLDSNLIDPDAWDDDEEPEAEWTDDPAFGIADPLLESHDDDEPMLEHDALLDEPTEDDPDLVLVDEVDDLHGLPVIDAVLTVTWVEDDRSLPAVAHPASPLTEWTHPDAVPGAAAATLDIGGVRVRTTLHHREGPDEQLQLGADVLRGRFLVRA